jgi:hypothetical protein
VRLASSSPAPTRTGGKRFGSWHKGRIFASSLCFCRATRADVCFDFYHHAHVRWKGRRNGPGKKVPVRSVHIAGSTNDCSVDAFDAKSSSSDSEMQRFESCRPNQPVPSPRVKHEGRSKPRRNGETAGEPGSREGHGPQPCRNSDALFARGKPVISGEYCCWFAATAEHRRVRYRMPHSTFAPREKSLRATTLRSQSARNVWAISKDLTNFDSEMQRFESRRPNRPCW